MDPTGAATAIIVLETNSAQEAAIYFHFNERNLSYSHEREGIKSLEAMDELTLSRPMCSWNMA